MEITVLWQSKSKVLWWEPTRLPDCVGYVLLGGAEGLVLLRFARDDEEADRLVEWWEETGEEHRRRLIEMFPERAKKLLEEADTRGLSEELRQRIREQAALSAL